MACLVMVGAADVHSHRGDPPVFALGRASDDLRGETGVRPSLIAAQETRKRPCMIPECGSQTKR